MSDLRQECLDAAQRRIDAEDDICFDICAEYCQIFANVRHMSWFKRAVANYLIDNVKKYAELEHFGEEP